MINRGLITNGMSIRIVVDESPSQDTTNSLLALDAIPVLLAYALNAEALILNEGAVLPIVPQLMEESEMPGHLPILPRLRFVATQDSAIEACDGWICRLQAVNGDPIDVYKPSQGQTAAQNFTCDSESNTLIHPHDNPSRRAEPAPPSSFSLPLRGVAMPRPTDARVRVESILHEVQRGSLPYFKQLGDRWPSDVDTAKRALLAILGHLGLDLIPHIGLDKPIEEGIAASISRSLASIKMLPTACKFFETVHERDRQEVPEIFESRRSGVFGWLHVLVRNVASLLPDPDNPADLPLATIAVMLRALTELCRKQANYYNFHDSIVDTSLEIWIASAERQRHQEPLNVHEYYRAIAPILQLFAECVAEGPLDSVTVNKINQFRRARTRRLVDAFITHCQQYASAYRE
ncbi:hypothetical protein FA13DRAFT_1799281 [Coprinellus micaceus]|uniref:Uncharacterized protein n=1 Tax=Coprinellus micaceus TaxID=71717 RepID=A0A4Y7SJK3_COPMI|nr:hypothetical protein FA13DRAFT_1799281 [Coprinellus micaceus]